MSIIERGPFPSTGASTFLGKGLASPLREDPVTGDFQRVSAEANVAQCIKDGILTSPGERVMREGFGTVVRTLLFENAEIIGDLIPPSVKDFIERWEPRVTLVSVTAQAVSQDSGMAVFNVQVRYYIRATNAPGNVVFPFYLTSGSD